MPNIFDPADPVLHRPPQGLTHVSPVQGQLVEEQHAAVGQCSGMSPERTWPLG